MQILCRICKKKTKVNSENKHVRKSHKRGDLLWQLLPLNRLLMLP
nr:MAG TPA: hypothetical protein [Bacteriophage sp.]